jgi:membrane protein DedA with SNARE-associated domain
MRLGAYPSLTMPGSAIRSFALAGAVWAAGTGYGTVHHDWRYELAIVLAVRAVALLLIGRSTSGGPRAGAVERGDETAG